MASIFFGVLSVKAFQISLEEPDARPSALKSAQYRSQGHIPLAFLGKFAHAPTRFARPIDERAKQR